MRQFLLAVERFGCSVRELLCLPELLEGGRTVTFCQVAYRRARALDPLFDVRIADLGCSSGSVRLEACCRTIERPYVEAALQELRAHLERRGLHPRVILRRRHRNDEPRILSLGGSLRREGDAKQECESRRSHDAYYLDSDRSAQRLCFG